MNRETIIRAWKDPTYRATLSASERAELPDHPAGQAVTELDDDALGDVAGGVLGLNSRDICPTDVRCATWPIGCPTNLLRCNTNHGNCI